MNDKNIIAGIVVILLAVGGVFFIASSRNTTNGNGGENVAPDLSSPIARFAQCLTDRGAVFYGAFWCPHCRSQKELFGSAASLLKYVECSTLDGNQQTQMCKDKGIKSYPTWEFSDGSRQEGERTFAQLSEKTGCVDPNAAQNPVNQEK